MDQGASNAGAFVSGGALGLEQRMVAVVRLVRERFGEDAAQLVLDHVERRVAGRQIIIRDADANRLTGSISIR